MATEDDKRRVELFTLRLSATERDRLEAIAKQAGTGAAAVIRDAVNAHCTAHGLPLVFDVKGAA